MFQFQILPVLLVGLAACYATTVVCRVALRRHHRAHWSLALVGSAIAAVLATCFIWLGLSLQPGELPYARLWLESFATVIAAGGLLALLPAQAILWYYRRALAKVEHSSPNSVQ